MIYSSFKLTLCQTLTLSFAEPSKPSIQFFKDYTEALILIVNKNTDAELRLLENHTSAHQDRRRFALIDVVAGDRTGLRKFYTYIKPKIPPTTAWFGADGNVRSTRELIVLC